MSYVRPDVLGFSPLAQRQVKHLRDVKDRTAPVYGLVVHCTGSTIVSKALAAKQDPFDRLLEYYGNPNTPYFATYAVDFDGTIAQVADEHEVAQHVGFPSEHRQAFLTGSWVASLPPAYVKAWRARWPGMRSPAHLFPGPSVNNVYLGVEMLVWQPGCKGAPFQPVNDDTGEVLGGLKYTEAQHRVVAALANDIAARWGWPVGWSRTGRIACHEDLNPLDRTSGGKGWDPGVIRPGDRPWFEMPFFASMLER